MVSKYFIALRNTQSYVNVKFLTLQTTDLKLGEIQSL